jgi:hypothetical protein
MGQIITAIIMIALAIYGCSLSGWRFSDIPFGLLLMPVVVVLLITTLMRWHEGREEAKMSKAKKTRKERKDIWIQSFWGVFIVFGIPLFIFIFIFYGFEDFLSSYNIGDTSQLAFSGRVSTTNDQWANDRLAILFLDNKEIGRGVTSVNTVRKDWDTINTDGIFVIKFANQYNLDLELLKKNDFSYDFFNRAELIGEPPFFNNFLYVWFGDVYEGDELEINIPQKRATFILKIIEGDSTTFPLGMLEAGSSELRDDGTVVFPLVNLSEGDQYTQPEIAVLNVAKLKTETMEVNRVTIPVDNCKGTSEFKQTYSETKSYTHSFLQEETTNIGGEVPVLAWAKILPELQKKYNFEDGQFSETSAQFEMAVAPSSNLTYTILWEEIWELGTVTFSSGNDILEISYKAKTNLIYRTSSESIPCP